MSEKINVDDLVDICTVTVDKSLPKEERILEFVQQVKDPYHFKCGKFTVTAQFNEDGPTLEECLLKAILDKATECIIGSHKR